MKKYIVLALLPLLWSFASIGGLDMNEQENYELSHSYSMLAYQAYHSTVQRTAPLPAAPSSVHMQVAFQSADYLDFITHKMSASSQVDYRKHYPDGRIIIKIYAPTLYAVNRPAMLTLHPTAPVTFVSALLPSRPSWETEPTTNGSGYSKYLIYNLDDRRSGNAFDAAQVFQIEVGISYPNAVQHDFTIRQ